MTEVLVKLRHELHKNPELSGVEFETAEYIATSVRKLSPDDLKTKVGGCGVAAIFDGENDGPSVLFRAELDALPIEEINNFSHKSQNKGVSHKCGHDGHMTIMMGLAKKVSQNRPAKGRVIILFQPAEETGEGARAVVADPEFQKIIPNYSYALHNLPGYSMGEVLIRKGTFNCASRGMIISLHGKTAHAAYPETGNSPAEALSQLLHVFPNLTSTIKSDELHMTTTVHASMGEKAFGTAPADAKLMVTLRSETNEGMDLLVSKATSEVEKIADRFGLKFDIEWSDVFDASVNDADCADMVADVAENTGHVVTWLKEPFRWSEDFGAISACAKGAMFAYGAGRDNPQIHNPDYDFPDELIDGGVSIFYEIYRRHLLR